MPYNSKNYSSKNEKTYIITWLSKESLDTWAPLQFVLTSDKETLLWDTIQWVLTDFYFDIFDWDHWPKLQAIFSIIEDWENVKLKANMSYLIRNIINKLSTQDKLGVITIKLINTTNQSWERRWGTIIENDWKKVQSRLLENDDKSIEFYTDKKTWKKEKLYHSIPDRNEKWYDSQYFDIIIGKRLKEIVSKNKFVDNTKEEDLPF